MKEQLIALGYKEHESYTPNRWCVQKKVDREITPDLKDDIFIYIVHNNEKELLPFFKDIDNTFDIYIVSDKRWNSYNIGCNRLKDDLFLNELPIIEKRLINAFVAIHNTK